VPLTHQASGTCLSVFKFHPNIVYYDMRSTAEYKQHKSYYHEPREQLSFRRNVPRGAAKLLIELLNAVEREHFTTISDFGQSLSFWQSTERCRNTVSFDLPSIRGSKVGSVESDVAGCPTAMKRKTFR